MRPGVDIEELVEMAVNTNVVDVLLPVKFGSVSIQRSEGNGRNDAWTRTDSQVIMLP